MLRNNAIQAYEESELKQEDLRKNKEAIERIKKYLSKFSIDIAVTSYPFVIDGIRFLQFPMENGDEIYAYEIIASRKCAYCGENLVLTVLETNDEITEIDVSKAEFGRWLIDETHLCEYLFNGDSKRKPGFI